MPTTKAFGAALGAKFVKRRKCKNMTPSILGIIPFSFRAFNVFKTCSFLFTRDSVQSEDTPVEYIVSGGLDDLVKVWELQDDRLELKHKLEGHSLGVVSVAISNEGSSEYKLLS